MADHGQQPFRHPFRLPTNTHQQEGAQRLGGAVHEFAEVRAGFEEAFDQRKHRAGVVLDDRAQHFAIHLVGNQPEYFADPSGGHRALTE